MHHAVHAFETRRKNSSDFFCSIRARKSAGWRNRAFRALIWFQNRALRDAKREKGADFARGAKSENKLLALSERSARVEVVTLNCGVK